METKTITIRVSAEVARLFEDASEERRLQLETLLSLRLSDVAQRGRTLEEIMGEISQKAQDRGLTPEILDSILRE